MTSTLRDWGAMWKQLFVVNTVWPQTTVRPQPDAGFVNSGCTDAVGRNILFVFKLLLRGGDCLWIIFTPGHYIWMLRQYKPLIKAVSSTFHVYLSHLLFIPIEKWRRSVSQTVACDEWDFGPQAAGVGGSPDPRPHEGCQTAHHGTSGLGQRVSTVSPVWCVKATRLITKHPSQTCSGHISHKFERNKWNIKI